MNRSVVSLSEAPFDVLVIGGGVYGTAVAREAALRGLTVAIVEKGDFCGATSANSLKIIHGGLRYLQQMDLLRLRESVCERRAMMTIAPHLVSPLPCAMPTCGSGMKSRPIMMAGMLANRILSVGCNRGMPEDHHIPAGKTIGRTEWLRAAPSLDDPSFTGAALWHDACAYNTERLVIATLRAAVEAGAQAANYCEVTKLWNDGARTVGVEVTDRLTGERARIRAATTIVCTGPWLAQTLALPGGRVPCPPVPLALGINVVLKRKWMDQLAVGLTAKGGEHGDRLHFFMPWRDTTVAGTYYRTHEGTPDELAVTREDLTTLLSSLNRAWPAANIVEDDIALVHAGVLPATGRTARNGEPDLMRHYRLIDHAREDAHRGLISLLGVKYTTARDVAAKAIDLLAKKDHRILPPSRSERHPLPGGDVPSLATLLRDARQRHAGRLDDAIIDHLAMNYGSELDAVIALAGQRPDLLQPLSDATRVIGAEIIFAIRNEMAQSLTDVCFRRTDLASAGIPDEASVARCAELMAEECGWDSATVADEVAAFQKMARRGIATA